MKAGRQYGLTGVAAARLPPLTMEAKCSRSSVLWVFMDDDFTNAFNATSQRGGGAVGAARRSRCAGVRRLRDA